MFFIGLEVEMWTGFALVVELCVRVWSAGSVGQGLLSVYRNSVGGSQVNFWFWLKGGAGLANFF